MSSSESFTQHAKRYVIIVDKNYIKRTKLMKRHSRYMVGLLLFSFGKIINSRCWFRKMCNSRALISNFALTILQAEILYFISKAGIQKLKSLRKHAYSNILNILTTKKWKKKSDINSDISHTSGQNIDCGYSLEPPRRGGSNEYPQSMFLDRNKKNNVYPCKPLFYYIKVGFKGVNII